MSAVKKRSIGEGDASNGRHSKRSKTEDGSVAIAHEAEDGASKEEDKRRKKHKKSKSDKTEKDKVKKSKAKKAEQEDGGEEEGAPATPPGDYSLKKDKSKRDKGRKKEKRKVNDRKKKSPKTAEGEVGTEQDAAERTVHAAGPDADSPSGAPSRGGSESEVQWFFARQQVAISDPRASGEALPQPILHFDHLPPSQLLSKKPFAAFETPTPIQSATWPFSLAGRDLIGIAETGSGKTMAFALPCIEALLSAKSGESDPKKNKKGSKARDSTVHPRAVIVAPTRELAMQTHVIMSGLAELVGLSAICMYGGSSKNDQHALLRQNRGADIVVATPGRLKDFLSEGCVSLSAAAFAVLDEADRMLDKGFEEDIRLILGSCPAREQRQTLMFTATWPTSVRGLAESFMVAPVKVSIGGKTRARGGGDGKDQDLDGEAGVDAEEGGTIELQANSRIEQVVEVVEPRGKEHRLLQLLQAAQRGGGRNDRILVFCLYKKEAVRVEQFLQHRGIGVASIHGDLRQEQRTRSLDAFKVGTTSVLVATDVAARGLDIPEVKLVINVTFPLTIEDYVHRIGRTGRAGKHGKAITLFTEHDKAHSGSLVNILRGAKQPVPEDLLKFGTGVKKKTHNAYGAFFKDVDMSMKGTKITFD